MEQWQRSTFGLELKSDRPLLPQASDRRGGSGPRVAVVHEDHSAVLRRVSGDSTLVWETAFDGIAYRMTMGDGEDHGFVWQRRAAFHLSAEGDVLTCGLTDPEDPAAARLLLDTVLWSVSLLRGYEILHGSAICLNDLAIAFVGGTGAGKTTLALELLRRGGHLLADDAIALSYVDGGVVAHPAPPVLNVPLRPAGARPETYGRVLARFGDEAWVLAAAPVCYPMPLHAVFLVERRAAAPLAVENHPFGAMALLPHAFGFPGARPRLGRQMEIIADLGQRTRVMRVSAPLDTPPGALADAVAASLRAEALVGAPS